MLQFELMEMEWILAYFLSEVIKHQKLEKRHRFKNEILFNEFHIPSAGEY